MKSDEQLIREVVERWWSASKAGDLQTVLSLMTDDVVFLVAGRPPMDKAEFAAGSTMPAGATRPSIDSWGDIKEIFVAGDLAYIWTALKVTVLPPGGAVPIMRTGHTLSVFKRVAGRWLLARDANLLVAEAAG